MLDRSDSQVKVMSSESNFGLRNKRFAENWCLRMMKITTGKLTARTNRMDMGVVYLLMALITKENGIIVYVLEKEAYCLQVVICMLETF